MTEGARRAFTDHKPGRSLADRVDRAILAARKAVFPHHGLMPDRPPPFPVRGLAPWAAPPAGTLVTLPGGRRP